MKSFLCVLIYGLLLGGVIAQKKDSKKSANFWYGGGAPGPWNGGFAGFGLSPQQNHDGLWTFVAVPIPLENQTLPEGDFPREQVAQAKLWGPIYRPGHGWVYGEAGTILVPRMPPYVPPTIIPPPRSGPGGEAPAAAAESVDISSSPIVGGADKKKQPQP